MADPVAGIRSARDPFDGGIMLEDGYQSLIQFTLDPIIEFFEKSITPPGIDGGDEIEQTTMLNTKWRTFSPRALKSLTEVTATVAYDPNVYTIDGGIDAAINRKDTITVHYPDESTLAFFGFLKSFTPNEFTEGEQPTAEITIVPTNFDHDNKVEAGPVMEETAGT